MELSIILSWPSKHSWAASKTSKQESYIYGDETKLGPRKCNPRLQKRLLKRKLIVRSRKGRGRWVQWVNLSYVWGWCDWCEKCLAESAVIGAWTRRGTVGAAVMDQRSAVDRCPITHRIHGAGIYMYICTRPCHPPLPPTPMGWVPYTGPIWDLPLPPPCGVVGVWHCPPPPPVVWCGCGMVCWVCMVCMVGLVWHVWKVWYVWYVW